MSETRHASSGIQDRLRTADPAKAITSPAGFVFLGL
jgi:hypothetical protein